MTSVSPPNSLVIYSPASLVSIFSQAFTVKEEKKIIQIKGVFLKTTSAKDYRGFIYNKLKDEASDKSLTIITPILIHNQLKDNTTIQLNGFVTRKADNNGAIQFQLNFVDLVNTSVNKYTEEDVKKIDIINAKLKFGFKDLDSLIKQHVYNNTIMKIVVIIGNSAIIDKDIITAVGSASVHYNLKFSRISFSSTKEISDEILKYDNTDVELICVARGGGDGMEPFNKPELVELILNRKKIIASAIGHDIDVTLFEKVADKKFALPFDFGNYLKQMYNDTVAELAGTKAKMQKDITDQLTTIYNEKVKTLKVELDSTVKLFSQEKKSIAELNDKRIKDLNEATLKLKTENDRLATQLTEARNAPSANYGTIIIVVIVVIIFLFIISHMK